MYNILFLYSEVINPLRGGVEKVTSILADFFESKGIGVYYLAFNRSDSIYNRKRQLFLHTDKDIYCKINKDAFITILKKYNISIIINQGALFEGTAKLSYIAKSVNVPIISVLHNSQLSIVDNYDKIFKNKSSIKNIFIQLIYSNNYLKSVFKKIYILYKRRHYRNLLKNSAYVVLLSEKYKNEIKTLSGCRDLTNVCVIFNPIIIDNSLTHKENIVLYVGRINTTQKQVDQLLDMWSKIGRDYSDWKLNIVGDGEDLLSLRNLYSSFENIEFFGYKDPVEFYKKAKIFCMTSSFEGLPMTLIEAQSFGVVPIVFESFASVTDIIRDSETGILITPYKNEEYINSLKNLMDDADNLEKLSAKAKIHSTEFDITTIGEKWLSLFERII